MDTAHLRDALMARTYGLPPDIAFPPDFRVQCAFSQRRLVNIYQNSCKLLSLLGPELLRGGDLRFLELRPPSDDRLRRFARAAALRRWAALRNSVRVRYVLTKWSALVRLKKRQKLSALIRSMNGHVPACVVCCDDMLPGDTTCAYAPCGHRAVCGECATKLSQQLTETCLLCGQSAFILRLFNV